jgi:general secretion pathway protein J
MKCRPVPESQPRRDACYGLTLIEMLIALAVFAVLGIMGYRAAAIAMESRQRVSVELQRWRDIANVIQVLETDLTQYVERPGTAGGAVPSIDKLKLAQTDGTVELSFLKLDGGGGSVRRRGYRLAGGQLFQLRWPGTDGASIPQSYPVLEGVKRMRWAIIGADRQRYTSWPDAKAAQQTTPAALDFELELTDVGSIRRLFVLR